jgi:hypothetical protein
VTAGVWGLAQLAGPARLLSAVGADRSGPPTWVVRVLGGRLLAQNALVWAVPARGVLLGGAAIDGLHALSMLAAAARWPGCRRAAVVSGVTAAATAAAGVAAAVSATPR